MIVDQTKVPGKPSLAKTRHSMRTPINHIIGYTEILIEEGADVLPEAVLKDLEKILSNGHVLLSLVNRYLGEEGSARVEVDANRLSHELRTPVTGIVGYAELLSEQLADEDTGMPQMAQDLAKVVNAAHTWLFLMEQHFEVFLTRGAAVVDLESLEAVASALSLISRNASPTPFGGRILVADDNEANRDIMRRRLEKLGYQTVLCENGEEALRLARSAEPDLILLAMLMPVLDGQATLQKLKSDDALRHVPVIMISALDQVNAIARCIDLGAEDYLPKPIDLTLLKSRVEATLEKKRLREREQIYLERLEEERARTDRLLINVFPHPIVDRLKMGEHRVVNGFDDVSVLFADFAGFTELMASSKPSALLDLLDELFSIFDEIGDRHSVEKIKTIGDCYMAAAGLPIPHGDHAFATAQMSLDMHDAVERLNQSKSINLKMRIGIATGPVIAGIVGRKRFTYDLWGDTVNIASRMESHGEPGKTQVSYNTYRLLEGRFRFEKRGSIDVKGKGAMQTYFLLRE